MNTSVTAALIGFFLTACVGFAQSDLPPQFIPVKPGPADLAIVKSLQGINAKDIETTIKTLVSFGTRNTLSSMESDLPSGTGINAASAWLVEQFGQISRECGGCLEVRTDVFTEGPADRIPQPTKITNVYAILRGSDPVQSRRMILVTGHYDSRNSNVLDARGTAPGANDDASGVAVSLACARVLSKLRFPATLVFAAVAGEEQGLNGSRHLAKLAHSEGWQLEGVLNNDIVGGNTTPGDSLQRKDRVRVFSEGIPVAASPEEVRRIRALGKEEDSASRQLARAVADAARSYFPTASSKAKFAPFLVSRPDRYLRGGDHTSFNQEGFAAVRVTDWREDFNHQHQNVVQPSPGSNDPVMGDLIQFVDFEYVAQVARLNAATMATFASSPGEPAKVSIVTEKLDNDTTLRWESPTAGVVANYEILCRETTASDWQYVENIRADPSHQAGTPVSVTLPVSKDNVVFGVRAVDAAGHRSLVVVP